MEIAPNINRIQTMQPKNKKDVWHIIGIG